jgi:CubicO group peptidase (beta-lactamase class C family)
VATPFLSSSAQNSDTNHYLIDLTGKGTLADLYVVGLRPRRWDNSLQGECFVEDKFLTFRIEPGREITLFSEYCTFKAFADGKLESVIVQSPNLSIDQARQTLLPIVKALNKSPGELDSYLNVVRTGDRQLEQRLRIEGSGSDFVLSTPWPGAETDLAAINVLAQWRWDKEFPIALTATVMWARPYASMRLPSKPLRAPPGFEQFPIITEPYVVQADRKKSATGKTLAGQTNIQKKIPTPVRPPDIWSNWETGLPEEGGLDSAALIEMFDFVRQKAIPVHSVQIVRHGRLLLDAYFWPSGVGVPHDVASVTKSVTSTLIGLAIQKGLLRDVNQPLLSLFPNRTVLNNDERKQKITLEDLLTMQAGWDCGFEPNEARLFEMRRSADWLQFMLDLPMVAQPGKRFAYCSGNPHVLSIVLSQVTGTNALEFARRELFEPLGIQDVYWPADPNGNTHGWGDLQLHPRDMARLGQLFLQRGRYGTNQVLSESWITNATRTHVEHTVNKDHYGFGWWVKGDDFPEMFEAVGRGGQRINVWPAKDMVLVFTGGGFEPGDLARFILKALRSDQSLPPNPEAFTRLQQRMVQAIKPPPDHVLPKLPATAARISRKVFRMSENTFGLRELTLTFIDPREANVDLVLWGKHERLTVGLDGVERFSMASFINLPPACKGQWIDENRFLLRMDLVSGINCYDLKLNFSEDATRVSVDLNERTGLIEEKFSGAVSK